MKRIGNLVLVVVMILWCFTFTCQLALAKSCKSSGKMHFDGPTIKDSDKNVGNNNGELNIGEGTTLNWMVPCEFCLTNTGSKTMSHIEFTLEKGETRHGDNVLWISEGNNNLVTQSIYYEWYKPVAPDAVVCFTFYVMTNRNIARDDRVTFYITDQRYSSGGTCYEDKENKIHLSVSAVPYDPPAPPSHSPPKPVIIQPIEGTEKYGSVQIIFSYVMNAIGYHLMQSKNNGAYEKVDSSTNPELEEFKVELDHEGCYSWYIISYNEYGDSQPSNAVSTCYQGYVPDNPKQTFSISPDTYPDYLSTVVGTFSAVPDALYYSIKSFCDYRQAKTYETDQLFKELVTDPSCQTMSWQVAPVVRGSSGVPGIYSDPVYATLHVETSPPISNHPPYLLQTSGLVQAVRVGDTSRFNLILYDTVPSKLHVKLIVNDRTANELDCDSANCVLTYSFVAAYAGQYSWRIVATDSLNGKYDISGGFYVLPGQTTGDSSTFKVDPSTNLVYFNGLWITFGMFNSALRNIYGDNQLLIEEIDGLNNYRITVMDQAMMRSLQAEKSVLFSFMKSATGVAGKFKNDIWPGFVDRCPSDPSRLCVATNISSSVIPVVEEIQEAASITVNALCFLYEGAVYLATGDKDYVEKMKNSAANVGFASVGILIPFVIDPQMVDAFFKAKDLKLDIVDAVTGGAKVIKADLMTITLKKVGDGLKAKNYPSSVITETLERIKRLKAPEAMMNSEENYIYLAEITRRGTKQGDYLMDLLNDLETLKVESAVLPLKLFDNQAYSLSKIDPARVEKLSLYTDHLDKEIIPLDFELPLKPKEKLVLSDLKGEVAAMRGRMYVDMIKGVEKVEIKNAYGITFWMPDDYMVVRTKDFSQFTMMDKMAFRYWKDKPGFNYLSFADLDMVRQFGNELWIFEVKASASLKNAEKSYDQLIKIEEAISYWKNAGLIPQNMVVRKIALTNDRLFELYPDETSGYVYGETKSAIKKFLDGGGSEFTIQ